MITESDHERAWELYERFRAAINAYNDDDALEDRHSLGILDHRSGLFIPVLLPTHAEYGEVCMARDELRAHLASTRGEEIDPGLGHRKLQILEQMAAVAGEYETILKARRDD